jgi:hypothetical protein
MERERERERESGLVEDEKLIGKKKKKRRLKSMIVKFYNMRK